VPINAIMMRCLFDQIQSCGNLKDLQNLKDTSRSGGAEDNFKHGINVLINGGCGGVWNTVYPIHFLQSDSDN
jgi:hypothetical protein